MAFTFYKDILYTTGTAPGVCTAIVQLKAGLVSAGWTVMSSGTGVSGTGSGVYNASGDSVTTAALMNNQQAWFRIRMPTGTREWTFQRSTSASSTADYQWRIKICRNGFTGGSPAAGITPTGDSTDTILFGSGTDSSPVTANIVYSTGTAYRTHIAIDTSPPYGWYLLGNQSTTATRDFYFMQEPLDGYASGDTDPYLYHCMAYNIQNGNGSNNGRGGDKLYMTTNGISCGVAAYWPSGVAWDTQAVLFQTFNASANSYPIPSGVAINPWNGKDEIFPIIWGRYQNRSDRGQNVGGYKGIGTMMQWVGQNRGTGNTFSVSSTSDRYAFGDTCVPWDGSTPNI
jgi:hypothetical protein